MNNDQFLRFPVPKVFPAISISSRVSTELLFSVKYGSIKRILMVYPNLVEVISNVALGLNLKKFNSLTWRVPLQVSLLALINSTALHPGCSQDSLKGKYAKCLPGKLTWSVLLHFRRPFVHSQLRQPDTWSDVSNEFYKCYSSWHCLKKKQKKRQALWYVSVLL